MDAEKITLATLPNATKQQVFDQIARHLLTQGQKSFLPDEMCAYRGDGGLMCAAGCLIADDEYMPSMEGKAWTYLWVHLGITRTDKDDLIGDLQVIHDDVSPTHWREHLHDFAIGHGLNTAVLAGESHE